MEDVVEVHTMIKMILILKLIFVFILLAILLILLIPKSREHFSLNTGISSISMLKGVMGDSPITNMNQFDDELVRNQSILSDQHSMLIAKRCYQFRAETNDESSEPLLRLMDANIPVDTMTFTYNTGDAEPPTMSDKVLKLLGQMKQKLGGVAIAGPVFVLVGQTPYYRNEQCGMMPVQFYASDYLLKPTNVVTEQSGKCADREKPYMKVYLLAIYPAYLADTLQRRIIPQIYENSADRTTEYLEKLVMHILRPYESVKQYCFMECAADNALACGCVSSPNNPESMCLAPRRNANTAEEQQTPIKNHFLMMYTVNVRNSDILKAEVMNSTWTYGELPLQAQAKHTAPDLDGNGNTVYLDRQNVECSKNGVLSQFQLVRPSSNKVQYNYTCQNASDIYPSVYWATNFNEEGGGNMVYLDRHNVQCPAGTALSRFRLQRNGQGKYRYNYRCSQVPSMGQCTNKSTTQDLDGGGNMVYLDRQNVGCGEKEVMTRFRLVRPTMSTVRYDYTCCARE